MVGTITNITTKERQEQDKDWYKMKKELKEQFLPLNYMPNFKNLHNLKHIGSIEEHIKAFYKLLARIDLNEK